MRQEVEGCPGPAAAGACWGLPGPNREPPYHLTGEIPEDPPFSPSSLSTVSTGRPSLTYPNAEPRPAASLGLCAKTRGTLGSVHSFTLVPSSFFVLPGRLPPDVRRSK